MQVRGFWAALAEHRKAIKMGRNGDDLGPDILSAYPVADQPMGASVPYMPHARPWNTKQVNAPPLGHGRDPSGRLQAAPGDSASKSEKEHPAKDKPVVVPMSRPTASVTDIPGAAAPAKRLFQSASFKSAGKPLSGGAMQRDMVVNVDSHQKKQPTYHQTYAKLWRFDPGQGILLLAWLKPFGRQLSDVLCC